MASYDGSVIIETRIDTDPFNKGLREMESSAGAFSSSLGKTLAKGMAGITLGFATKEIASFAGIMTDLESRAKIASKGLEDTSMIMERLKNIADTAYAPLEATANAFMNNATALNALGLSMTDQLDMTEALTNALIVSGTKGEDFEMVMNAVNRSLAVGKMATRELEMVLKYGGAAAEAMAKHMGTTVIGLRQMAADGKLTAKVISESLIGSMDEFKQQANDMPATISDAFVRLRNQALITAGELNKTFQFEATAVQGIDALKEKLAEMQAPLETAISLGTTFFVALLGGQALTAITKYVASQAALSKSIITGTAAEGAATASKHKFIAAISTAVAAKKKEVEATQQNALAANAAAVSAAKQAESARVSAAAALQTTQALIAETEAYYANEIAKTKGMAKDALIKKSKVELNALRATEAVQLKALALAQTQATAANTALSASNVKSAASMAANKAAVLSLTAAFAGLRTAGASVMAFLGGPIGLALTAVAGGVYLFSQYESEGEKVTARYGAEVEELAKKLGLVRGGADEASKGIKDFNKFQLNASVKDDKKSLEAMRGQLAGLVDSYRKTQRQVTNMGPVVNMTNAITGLPELDAKLIEFRELVARGDLSPELFKDFVKGMEKYLDTAPPEVAAKLQKIMDAINNSGLVEKVIVLGDKVAEGMAELNRKAGDEVKKIDFAGLLQPKLTQMEELYNQYAQNMTGWQLMDLSKAITGHEKSLNELTEYFDKLKNAAESRKAELEEALKIAVTTDASKEMYQALLSEYENVTQQIIALDQQASDARLMEAAKFHAEAMRIDNDILNNSKTTAKQREAEEKRVNEAAVKAAMDTERAHLAAYAEIQTKAVAAADIAIGAFQRLADAGVTGANAIMSVLNAAKSAASAGFEGIKERLAGLAKSGEEVNKTLNNVIGGGGGGGKKGGGGGNTRKQALDEIEMTLAKLEGRTADVKLMETNKEIERFTELVKKAGLSGQTAADYIERFKEAQGKKVSTDHLQEQLRFYDELRHLMPAAGEKYDEIRKQLLDLEEEQLRAIGISEEFLEVWRKQKELGEGTDFFSGLMKAIQDYIDKLSDANLAQEAFTSTMNAIQSNLVDLIMGSKDAGEAFRAMADSILKALVEMMVQMLIMKPIAQSLQNIMGGFGGGAGGFGFANGGVFAPNAQGISSYSGQIIKSPTLFPFASGVGLMGEAGYEAVMPLGRTASGKLGVLTADNYQQGTNDAPINVQIVNQTSTAVNADVSTSHNSDGSSTVKAILKQIDGGLEAKRKRGTSVFGGGIERDGQLSSRYAKQKYMMG